MRTKYCPHCGSQKIHKVEEEEDIGICKVPLEHYHECEECQETWEHHIKDNDE